MVSTDPSSSPVVGSNDSRPLALGALRRGFAAADFGLAALAPFRLPFADLAGAFAERLVALFLLVFFCWSGIATDSRLPPTQLG